MFDPLPQERQQDFPFVETTTLFVGPLPCPDDLARYKHIDPDLPERIVQMAENEQRHRQGIELMMVRSEVDTSKRSQNLTVYLASITLAAAVPIAIWSNAAAGVMTALAPIIVTVATKIWTSRDKNKDAPEKPEKTAPEKGKQ